MIGRDTVSVLAPALGPLQKKWLCNPLPLFMAVSMIPGTNCATFELLMHAAFAADEIWGFMLEPARPLVLENKIRQETVSQGKTCTGQECMAARATVTRKPYVHEVVWRPSVKLNLPSPDGIF